jgi:hypothetical protein
MGFEIWVFDDFQKLAEAWIMWGGAKGRDATAPASRKIFILIIAPFVFVNEGRQALKKFATDGDGRLFSHWTTHWKLP